MLKKSIFAILAATILSLFCINISYAEGENNSMMQNLGNTISNSIDKTESTLNNGMHMIGNEVTNTTDEVRNSWNTMTNNLENTIDNDRNTNYTAYRTSADETTTGNMSTTAWTWVIVSMVAIIIITAIWYYAVKSTDRR